MPEDEMTPAAVAAYLTEKTGETWTADEVGEVFDGDYDGETFMSASRYRKLDGAMRKSLPKGLFDEVECCARIDYAVHYAARGGGNPGRGADPLCIECGELFLKYWGKAGEAGAPWPEGKGGR